jgi:putative spermidine/putrescine transport system substrate-binding protein
MKSKLATLMCGAALAMTGVHAHAADMADSMTIVSWGGAYQKSQINAYAEPYKAMHPEVEVIWDESSNEAVAKLRAMNEAGNITWDLVDVVAADAIRLCDEGLAMEYDPDELLAAGDDGTPASDDFGDLIVSDCFIPQIVYSTTFGYRTDMVGDTPPTNICDVFDLEKYPGKRALEKRPINNMEWALLCDGVAKEDVYDVLETEEGQAQALAKLDTIKDQVVWWSAGADTPQLLADGEVVMGSTYNGRLFSLIEEQDQPVAMLWDARCSTLTVGSSRPVFRRSPCSRQGLRQVCHRHTASGRPGEVHLLRSGTQVVCTAGRSACRPRHRNGSAHADGSGKREEHLPVQLHMVG